MTVKLAPNLNIQYKWSLGEDNWNTGMDENLLKIDSLLHLAVASKDLNSPPSTIVSGDRYIIGANPINEWQSKQNNIAVYYDSVWNFYTPKSGFIAYVKDINKLYIYDIQNTWTEIQTNIEEFSQYLISENISFTPTVDITSTTVQDAIQEVRADAIAAQAPQTASTTAFTPTVDITSTTVQDAIVEVRADAIAAIPIHTLQTASQTAFTPTAYITSTTVQDAIQEVRADAIAAIPIHTLQTASQTAFTPTVDITSTTVQDAIQEVNTKIDTVSGEINLTNSITNGDTTHAPDGNSVFDALASKANLSGSILTNTIVNGLIIAAGPGGPTLTVEDTSNISGTNTGDQINITGNAATATKLATARAISGASFDGSAAVTIDHSGLSSIGTNTHAQIDTALTRLVNTSGTNTGDQNLQSVITTSITDGDTTHAPDGNSVFDALALKINTSEKGSVSGVATLDASGLVPTTQLPSYVDDVLEYSTLATFPVTGTAGKIYVDLATNKTYRWSGSTYIYITSGAVDSVAGKTGVVSLVKADVGLGNVDNTADVNKPVVTTTVNGLMSSTDKVKLNAITGTNTGDQTGGTPALTLGITNIAGTSTNFIRRDDTILAFDDIDPSTQAFGDVASAGIATVAARRDHKHAMPESSNSNPIYYGTGNPPTTVTTEGALYIKYTE